MQIPGHIPCLPLGKLVFLRHGQTAYTDIFPDLTGDGIVTAKEAAKRIKPVIDGLHPVMISSPRPRARGTGHFIKIALGHRGEILIDDRIRAADVYDKKAGWAIYQEHVKGGSDHLSIMYSRDPRYDDSAICEPRWSVKKRFYEYLEFALKIYLKNRKIGRGCCLIHTTHYEFLYHFVETLFALDYTKDRPLLHGEIIVLTVFATDKRDIFAIQVEFRDMTKLIYFDCQTKEIVNA